MNKRDLFFGFTFNQDDKRRKFLCLRISAFVTIDVYELFDDEEV